LLLSWAINALDFFEQEQPVALDLSTTAKTLSMQNSLKNFSIIDDARQVEPHLDKQAFVVAEADHQPLHTNLQPQAQT
jgi:hypothetical protein